MSDMAGISEGLRGGEVTLSVGEWMVAGSVSVLVVMVSGIGIGIGIAVLVVMVAAVLVIIGERIVVSTSIGNGVGDGGGDGAGVALIDGSIGDGMSKVISIH